MAKFNEFKKAWDHFVSIPGSEASIIYCRFTEAYFIEETATPSIRGFEDLVAFKTPHGNWSGWVNKEYKEKLGITPVFY